MILKKKSLFHWIGGKKWIENNLKDIIINQNKKIDTYIEPFVGGMGAFKIFYNYLPNNINRTYLLNDINYPLISLYKNIQSNYIPFLNQYKKLINEYNKTFPQEILLSKDKEDIKKYLNNTKNYYLEQRYLFNKLKNNDEDNIKLSILFLFIMKHCFNSIYRENKKGDFNVGFNWKNKKDIFENDKNDILFYHNFFKMIDIKFFNLDAFDFLNKIPINDQNMYYFDPPYIKANNINANPNNYNKNEFNIDSQNKLLDYLTKINNFIYSNHNNQNILDFCKINNFDYKLINRNNIVTVKKEDRSLKISEILIFKNI